MANKSLQCPCGSGKKYTSCCDIYIRGRQHAPTAEALMRSRYTAYTINDEAYLLASWHPSTRHVALRLDEDISTKWMSLEVLTVKKGGEQDNQGTVEFIARYKINGKAGRIHEVSRFTKQDQQWFYLDGDLQ